MLGRKRYGGTRDAFLMLEMFVGGVAPFAAILLLGRGSSVVQRLFCGLVVGWPILRAFGNGSRSPLVTSVGCLLAVFYWKATPALRKKMILAGIACLPLVYGVGAAMVVSRGSGQFSWEDRKKATYVGNEMFRMLLFIKDKFPDKMEYQYGYPYIVQLLNPIPRFLWKDKPKLATGNLTARLAGTVNEYGEEWVSISPGLIGEMYMNFGVFGIIALSAFGGWLVKGWDSIAQVFGNSLPTLMYYSGGLGVLFIMGLSFTMSMFYGLLSLAMLA
jgi:oligosaccharide repeat unit polymerase